MTDLLVEPKVQEPDTGSPDDKAHYAKRDDITQAAILGGKVKALCGVEFEPIRDPSRFPMCEDCVRLLSQLGDRDNN
jgi:hypothetical protein